MTEHPIRIAALYHFTRFDDPAALRPALAALCDKHGVKGTLLLAHEGINGTIAGSDAGIQAVLDHIRALPGCADLEVKESRADTMPFYRSKVRVKAEIVTMGQPDLDPVEGVGTYVAPEDWNALISDPDVLLVDTRNDYEVEIGSFKGAVDPKLDSFREFPDWAAEHLDPERTPKVAMFCTGGIRCEKSTSLLRERGFQEVYHLEGGILKYLEEVPETESLWQGECYVFDQRVSLRHGLEAGTYDLCRACRRPLSDEDKASPHYRAGVSCGRCVEDFTDEQKAQFAERERQMRLADARGAKHLGARLDDP